MVLNLLTNALKVSPPGGRITLRSRIAQARWRVSVEDEGPGLDEDQRVRPRLLELLPDQSNGADSDAAYALGFALRLPPTPTPVPVVEDAPPAPTLTPTPMPVPVPPLAAHSASGAVERLRAVGLVARTQSADRYSPAGPGTVAAQDPRAGSLLPPGSTVTP